jgi:hypothetical protein
MVPCASELGKCFENVIFLHYHLVIVKSNILYMYVLCFSILYMCLCLCKETISCVGILEIEFLCIWEQITVLKNECFLCIWGKLKCVYKNF